MENKQKLYGMLGLCAKAGKVVAGNQTVLEAIEKRKIKLLILAEDSSNRTKEMFQKIGEEKKIKIVICLTMEELSEKIGKQNKAIVGISDENFVKAIQKILNGGETIG